MTLLVCGNTSLSGETQPLTHCCRVPSCLLACNHWHRIKLLMTH